MLRWFPILVLVRPLIDNLYFLKEVSPLLSPPYIVGVLTPALCIAAVVRYKVPLANAASRTFSAWSALLILGALLLFVYDPLSLLSLEFILKITMPVYLFFFLRIFMRSRQDLHGILNSILYSAGFVALILLFEIFINPISIEESRGLERIQGSFGDVVSYGMYIVFSTAIVGYYFFSRQHIVPVRKLIWLASLVGVISLLGLINIHHTATYSIFLILVGLFFIFNMQTTHRGVGIGLLIVVGLGIAVFGSAFIYEKITPLIETDLAVYQGEKDSDQLFHGRMGRWRFMLHNFFTEPPHVQLFGLPLSFNNVYAYIGIGSHNDFFRILFATGFVGLFLYLRFLWLILLRARSQGMAQQYLLYGTLAALLLYSISVTPTFYAPFLYFILSVFVFVMLPKPANPS